MKPGRLESVAKRVWIWLAILTAIVWIYPVEYRTSRIAMIAGMVMTWLGALLLWRKRKVIAIPLLLVSLLFIMAVCLPGRPVEPERLRQDYVRCLRLFRNVRYVWGGEGWLGIDCSGLVRKGMILAQLSYGAKTANGRPIRDALYLWWHDCPAAALRDGYLGLTTEFWRSDGIVGTDEARLRAGDLAVTSDGVHVMACLGGGTWIEADPAAHRVIEVVPSTGNSWFNTPVVFVRWTFLAE